MLWFKAVVVGDDAEGENPCAAVARRRTDATTVFIVMVH
jgi:hypothetical protein